MKGDMRTYRIIGNMTGNSMDAVDLVLTEFRGENMRDICSFSCPYKRDMQLKMENLRKEVYNKSVAEIEKVPDFQEVHDEYVRQVADCVNEMCRQYGIDKNTIDAIGFHGKTLDHNPPSKSGADNAYTLQIGSGKMLADLTGLPVVYDFRSDAIMIGLEGAPLAPQHNAKVAKIEGDGCYYNGGNTSNFTIVKNGEAVLAADSGPFNEYIDGYVRRHTDMAFDAGGRIGEKGRVLPELLVKLYEFGMEYYERKLPKSGDPAYYHTTEIFEYVESCGVALADAVRTFEYFAAYVAVQALTQVVETVEMPRCFLLFGGGWKNPIVCSDFRNILSGKGYVLPQHRECFSALMAEIDGQAEVKISAFGDYMEARLFADMARCKLENLPWKMLDDDECAVVCGIVANPDTNRQKYDDRVNRAAKNWQENWQNVKK